MRQLTDNNDYNFDEAFRTATTTTRLVTTNASADTLLAPSSRQRIAIFIYGTTATVVNVNDTLMTATNTGFAVSSTAPFRATQREFGDFPSHEFHGFCGAAINLVVIEVFATCPCPTGH